VLAISLIKAIVSGEIFGCLVSEEAVIGLFIEISFSTTFTWREFGK